MVGDEEEDGIEWDEDGIEGDDDDETEWDSDDDRMRGVEDDADAG